MDELIVLCVDDDFPVINALRSLLVKHLGAGYRIEIAESGPEALEIAEDLAQQKLELAVVISDFIMPQMRGDELLILLHGRSPNTIKIMLTGQSDFDGVKRTINHANLYRFLEKPFNNADLILTIKSAAQAYRQARLLEKQNAELRDINARLEAKVMERTRELVEKNQELLRISVTDKLTGLFNRLKLDQIVDEEHSRSARYDTPWAVIIADIDHFKSVNDTHGHLIGDQVLIATAQLLSSNTRDIDVVGRWGGEEFLLICRETGQDGALSTAEKLRELIQQFLFPVAGRVTASFGIAAYRSGHSTVETISRADKALYRAKENGRNRVEVAD